MCRYRTTFLGQCVAILTSWIVALFFMSYLSFRWADCGASNPGSRLAFKVKAGMLCKALYLHVAYCCLHPGLCARLIISQLASGQKLKPME